MFVVVRSPRYALASLAVSLIIFGVIYFAVIRPDNNTANNAIRATERQAQQVVSQANRASGGAVPKKVQNLTSCIAAAGTNVGAVQACQAKY
jgi:flagellar biosynthesis/type III secretory pathway M-ring protein FliF/YscJ